jgi:hypothetical protein
LTDKEYFSMRSKADINSRHINLEDLKSLFVNLFDDLDDDHNFKEPVGHDIDNNRNYWYAERVKRTLLDKTRKSDLWPIHGNINSYSEDYLFDIIEFCYDYLRDDNAKQTYRQRINKHLKDYKKGYELDGQGYIHTLIEYGLESIFDVDIKSDDQKNIVRPIKEAIRIFKSRNPTSESRKSALLHLSGVLEYMRDNCDFQDYFLDKKDSGDLFNIMNNFNIRHSDKSQRSEYDHEIWHKWFFYCFLSSIHCVLHLKDAGIKNI